MRAKSLIINKRWLTVPFSFILSSPYLINGQGDMINTKEDIEFNINIKKVALYLISKLGVLNIELMIN